MIEVMPGFFSRLDILRETVHEWPRMSDPSLSASVAKKDPFFWVIIAIFGMSLVCLGVFTWLDARMLRTYDPASGLSLSSATLLDLLISMRELVWGLVMLNCFGVATCVACYFYGKKRWLKTGE